MKAYKVFNENWECRDFQYKVGKKYIHKRDIVICNSGFHACINLIDCFNYYDFNPENKVAIVEMDGDIIEEDNKCVCSEIEIIKEITWNEVLNMVNTGKGNIGYSNSGNRNSGDSNSGNRNSGDSNSGNSNSGNSNSGNSNSGYSNSGYRNSGDSNSGYSNSGYRNSGGWNSTTYETGYFNSKQSNIINVFNKPCDKYMWGNANKPDFIYNIELNKWIWFSDMSEDEKKEYKNAYVCDGYLKTISYKKAWENAYDNATKADIKLLKKLPNFDSKVFYDITGIKL